jgi:hypothetical protein
MYIACPKCDWRPDHFAQWSCSCGRQWNTFETRGVCPRCSKQWKMAQCSTQDGCGEWSDHEEWYHEDDELTVAEYVADPSRLLRMSNGRE